MPLISLRDMPSATTFNSDYKKKKEEGKRKERKNKVSKKKEMKEKEKKSRRL